MPGDVCICCPPNNPYSHVAEWFSQFTTEDKMHAIVVETFSYNKAQLEDHLGSQIDKWSKGKFLDAGVEAAKYWKTMHRY